MQFSSLAVALGLALVSFQAAAQSAPEALIRKNLPARLSNFPAIDEIKPAPIAGLYEVRLNGADIVYTDARGDFLIQGEIIDVQKRINLTKERIDKLSAIDFKALPFKDAFTIVRGNGKRKTHRKTHIPHVKHGRVKDQTGVLQERVEIAAVLSRRQ